MRFYHDSKPNWLTNVLSRAQHWKILSNNHFAKWVDGCVLCGRTTAQSRLSPRLCALCTEQLPHHLSNNLSDTNEFHRCAQCAHLLSTPEPYCVECLTEPPAFTHTIAFADYAEQMQHMLLQYKFHNALHLAPVLADALRHALSHYAQQHRPDVIVLVPQLDERTAERGFNHLRLLMQQISLRDIWREAVPTYAPDAIIRLHHERLQIHVKPDMRRKQVKNAFTVADKKLFENTHVLLIDDIITTGATLNEIARVLKNAGARQVDNVVIARTRKTPLK